MRVLDGKYHIENDQVVKTTNGVAIPEDEPVILFRARDHNALLVLRSYMDICKSDGCTPYHLEGIQRVIDLFEKFKEQHPERMKQPGCTLGK